jgi:CDP-paratose 2-epimerase
LGYQVVGLENMRQYFFGEEASTLCNRDELEEQFDSYTHCNVDVCNEEGIAGIFRGYRHLPHYSRCLRWLPSP